MKPVKDSLHTAQAVLHTLRLSAKCFMRRQPRFIFRTAFALQHSSACAGNGVDGGESKLRMLRRLRILGGVPPACMLCALLQTHRRLLRRSDSDSGGAGLRRQTLYHSVPIRTTLPRPQVAALQHSSAFAGDGVDGGSGKPGILRRLGILGFRAACLQAI